MPDAPPAAYTFRVSRLAYVVVLFLLFGAIPLAFAANGAQGPPAQIGISTAILLVPVLAAVYVARTATVVDGSGIRVRAVLGERRLAWDELRGLSVERKGVYAVLRDGAVRLPCVQVAQLADVSRASGGRLPEIAEPTPKGPPQRKRRR